MMSSGPFPTELERGDGLVLIGYRGTGKSTIGRLVARRTGLRFLDADRELERRTGRKISAIFAESGEGTFRDLESETLLELTAQPSLIIATGGGAILRPENRLALRRCGLVVWLTARPDTLAARLLRDGKQGQVRPALTSAGTLQEIAEVLAIRLPLYEETADIQVDTETRSVARVANEVTRAWLDWKANRNRSPLHGGDPR